MLRGIPYDIHARTIDMEQLIAEVAEDYRKMSLLELLGEENMMAMFWHRRRPDSPRRKLRAILRSEIEKKLS